MKTKAVTIIVPVYGDWQSLSDCIDSLQKHVSKKHRVLLVNDCGPEADEIEKNILQKIEGQANFFYHRNEANLGFVKNCNHAVFELDKTTNDILLLNSDTKVTEGFLEELIEVLYDNDTIGVVSPRTNNATIATIPLSAMKTKGLSAENSHNVFLKYKDKLPRYKIAPVAHGFCMLIRRSLIKKYGLFDEIFGKGYGEEVDFCQRIGMHGFVSVFSNRSFVYHLEARSFTLETKAKLLDKNNQIVRKRYPDYQQSVRDYIKKVNAEEEKIMKPGLYRLKSITRILRTH